MMAHHLQGSLWTTNSVNGLNIMYFNYILSDSFVPSILVSLSNESRGLARLVPPGWSNLTSLLVVSAESVNSALDDN